MSRLRAWAELARLSNAPTCVTNVLVGVALASGPMQWPAAAAMSVSILLLYVAGMALNDVVDLAIDRRERPERPLPSGRITARAAIAFIVACVAIGLGIAAWHGLVTLGFAAALVLAIVLYDVLHKRAAASVLLMGTCRALVYVTAAAAAGATLDRRAAILAAALGVYIVMVTVVARVETSDVRWGRFRIAALLPFIALVPLFFIRPADPRLTIIAAGLAIGWIIRSNLNLVDRPPRIGAAVMGWLAAICLMDGFYLMLLDRPLAAGVAAACFVVTVLAHRRVAGS